MHRHELNHLRNRRHEEDDDAIHMKGGGWLKKILHQPLGKRDSGVRRGLRKAEKVMRKEVLPITLPIMGGIIAGPLGATAAGAITGSMRSSHNVGKNMFKGALKGLAVGGGMTLAGQMMGGGSLLGGLSNPFSGLMGGSAPTVGAGHSAGAQAANAVQKGAGKGLLGGLFGKVSGVGGGIGGLLGSLGITPMDALLMGGAALGQLKSRTKPDPEQERRYNEEKQRQSQALNRPNPHDLIHPHEFSYIREPNPNYGKARLDPNAPLMGEEPFLNNYAPRQLAEGGYVHGGAIPGNSGGQDDDYDTHIPAGSYVWDATSSSLLGDGNSENGIKKIREMRDRFLESGIVKNEQWNPERVKVKLSPGEIVIEPEVVEALGKGNRKKGIKKLDNARHALRKEKGLTKFLPPKSKSLDKYLRG